MKILFISNLFPDTLEPNRGSDNAELLGYLKAWAEVRVLCPRPSLPWLGRQQFTGRPAEADFAPVFVPATYIPKIGGPWNHRLMARALRPALLKIRAEFPFDVVLCSWLYPDACAVARLAGEMAFPFVSIAQGSDVHQYLQMPARRGIILSAMERSAAIITRSGQLAELLAEAGVPRPKLKVIYNGVDTRRFQPGDSAAARQELALPRDGQVVLFVGNLLPIKNPVLLVDAHAEVCRQRTERRTHLVIVGGGPLGQHIRRRADAAGFGERVWLAGRKSPLEVARYLQAADVLALSSRNEGVPNVVLEAFAAGLPVVSTRVGGIPEVLCHDYLGKLVEPGHAGALAAGLIEVLGRTNQCHLIRQHGLKFSWEKTADDYATVLERAGRSGPTSV